MTRVLLTGAGGFVGSHTLRHLLHETDWDVTATDSFRHKGRTDRITAAAADIEPPGHGSRLQVHTHDLRAPISPQMAAQLGDPDYVVAMASQSHVDRSIADPAGFVRNNVDVILTTLEYARQAGPKAVVVVSTDEVYGPTRQHEQGHREWAPILPSNPYAASKAAQEAIAISYWRTYAVPVVVVNCMNLVGEMQDGEKYLPTLIRRISRGDVVDVHGRPGDIGSRHYLHARNLADAVLFILRTLPPRGWRGQAGVDPVFSDVWHAEQPDRYNVVGPDRISNLQLAQMVAGLVGKPLKYALQDFHTTRPGHDPHYGLDGSKLAALGWKPPIPFEASLAKTVAWTLAHPEWLE